MLAVPRAAARILVRPPVTAHYHAIRRAIPCTHTFRTFATSSPTGDSADSSAAAAAEEVDEFASPSTANTFRSYVRSRSAGLAAKAAAVQSGSAPREWRDSAQMRALKEEASGGVIRRTRARIHEGRLTEFLAWAEDNLAKAYLHEGFKGAYITANHEESVVENITVWTSEHAVNQNSHLPVYRSTMQELGQFCVDAPEIDLKLVSLAIPGHQKSSAANTQRQEEEQAAPLTEAEMNTR